MLLFKSGTITTPNVFPKKICSYGYDILCIQYENKVLLNRIPKKFKNAFSLTCLCVLVQVVSNSLKCNKPPTE